jgi:hypothetical protein
MNESFVARSVWLFAAVALLSCSRFRKAKECDVLAKAVSGWIAKQPKPSPASAEPKELAKEARATARRYEALDRELGRLEIKSPDLVPRVKRYREIAAQATRALDDVALALSRNDAETARRRRVEFGVVAAAEAPLVAEINASCRR